MLFEATKHKAYNVLLAATREYHGIYIHPSQCPQPNAPCTHTGSPSRANTSGFPLGGFATQVRAAETPDVIMTPVSYFWSPQVFPERPVNTRYWPGKFPSKSQFAETMHVTPLLNLVIAPGKKTKNTLACVFTVANVLGTWERYMCTIRY